MTIWKVGDRARVRKGAGGMRFLADDRPDPRGLTCTIVAIPSLDERQDCAVEVDGDYPPEPVWGSYGCWFDDLEPLIDPKADEFIERIKKIAREPRPMATELLNQGGV